MVGGNFNLQTDHEPAISQLARLLMTTGLTDVCSQLHCDHPANVDKFLYRSGAKVQLQAESWSLETAVFATDAGAPLSDHAPLAVRFAWSQR
jgi:hypothetical protein